MLGQNSGILRGAGIALTFLILATAHPAQAYDMSKLTPADQAACSGQPGFFPGTGVWCYIGETLCADSTNYNWRVSSTDFNCTYAGPIVGLQGRPSAVNWTDPGNYSLDSAGPYYNLSITPYLACVACPMSSSGPNDIPFLMPQSGATAHTPTTETLAQNCVVVTANYTVPDTYNGGNHTAGTSGMIQGCFASNAIAANMHVTALQSFEGYSPRTNTGVTKTAAPPTVGAISVTSSNCAASNHWYFDGYVARSPECIVHNGSAPMGWDTAFDTGAL